jgi:RNA polymerase sigma-70 factor, ECF subfamily
MQDPTSLRDEKTPSGPSDEEIVRRVVAGEVALFELLMRRHNTRVYRAIRSILRDEAEVEDAMQQAYLQAYSHLSEFQFGARFSTWLVRIAMNEALMRTRKQARLTLVGAEVVEERAMSQVSPEKRAEDRELAGLVENAIDALPDLYRSTFMLRTVEGLSTNEVAQILGVSEEVVKTRLHRARGLVRDAVFERVGGSAEEAFPFHAPRCDRVVFAVMDELKRPSGSQP